MQAKDISFVMGRYRFVIVADWPSEGEGFEVTLYERDGGKLREVASGVFDSLGEALDFLESMARNEV